MYFGIIYHTWAQNLNLTSHLVILKKRTSSKQFLPRQPLFRENAIKKFIDKVYLENIFFFIRRFNKHLLQFTLSVKVNIEKWSTLQ